MSDVDEHSGSNNSNDNALEWWKALRRTINGVLDSLETAAQKDPRFVDDLMRVFGRATSTSGAPASSGQNAESVQAINISAPAVPISPVIAPPPPPPPRPPQFVTPEPFHLIGPRVIEPAPVVDPPKWTQRPFEPAEIATRCRFKAEATRWQSERSRRLDSGEDVSEGDRELVARARASNTYLWMVSPNKWRERSEDSFRVVAGCYDALADAVEVMGLADRLGREQEAAMKLLAEAQSSVRAAVEDYASTGRDEDQEITFGWLRRETDVRRVYVEYMQLDRPAPPDNYADLRQRIAELRQALDGVRGRDQSLKEAIQKIKYHANKLAQRPPGELARPDSGDVDFDRIAAAAETVIDAGVPPTDLRLREALLPAIDRFVDSNVEGADDALPPALARIVGAVQDYLDQREADAEADSIDAAESTEDADPLIATARQLAAGRDAVLIGGVPSEPHRRRLERGLDLRSLNWIRIEHHESFDAAASSIRRPGVGLVLLMTRWRSHRDGPAARALCKELGIPLVELPAGYNLRQVAHRIVEQMSPDENLSMSSTAV
jgi:hypothetical protein